jgi:3' terminal RNA ribose 2'-O-methyltransferase Hen1
LAVLLTLTTTASPATDLGFVLRKHPARVHEAALAFGRAYVFYPEATAARCTAALLLEVDPIALSRGRREGGLEPYVNDRPYAASSFLSVALARVLGSALGGRCDERPELAARRWPLEAHLPAVPCRGGEPLLRRLFEPLGYEVAVAPRALDARFPSWGPSPYFGVTLRAERPVAELLAHLYVLVPVLDDDKHYFVGDDEVDKLLARGEGWLAAHPDRELIARRYLKHQAGLTRRALAQLVDEDAGDPDAAAEAQAVEEDAVEARVSLADARTGAVLAVLRGEGARSVLDLGCGEGRLLRALLDEPAFERVVGLDVAHRALERAAERLHLERMPERRRARLELLHGSLTYRDRRLEAFDAAAVIEVVEHLDPGRLRAFERVLFEHARPRVVVMTTPNVEYNVHFADLPAGRLRHRDHRFEWTRAEFQAWAGAVAARHGYGVSFLPVGPEDPATGAPTQMGVFRRG